VSVCVVKASGPYYPDFASLPEKHSRGKACATRTPDSGWGLWRAEGTEAEGEGHAHRVGTRADKHTLLLPRPSLSSTPGTVPKKHSRGKACATRTLGNVELILSGPRR